MFPSGQKLTLRLEQAQIVHAQIVVKLFLHEVWRCLVQRASTHAPSTRVTIQEGSLTLFGLLVSGHGSRILEGACYGDLALLVLGSPTASWVAATCFSVNSDFAPRGERHVHHNHMVGAVRLVGVYG